MKKFINDLELIDSGVIHIHNNNELKINITNDLFLRFRFTTDDEDKSHRVDKVLNNNKDLSIVCVNFDEGLGEGILTPVRLGTLGGKEMFFSLFVWSSNGDKGMRVLSYNLYQRN